MIMKVRQLFLVGMMIRVVVVVMIEVDVEEEGTNMMQTIIIMAAGAVTSIATITIEATIITIIIQATKIARATTMMIRIILFSATMTTKKVIING